MIERDGKGRPQPDNLAMRLHLKYISAGVLVTIGCAFLSRGDIVGIATGPLFVTTSLLVTRRLEDLKKPLRLRWPKWSIDVLLEVSAVILLMALLMVSLAQLTQDQFNALFGNRYFIVPFWMLHMCLLVKDLIRERSEIG